MTLHHIIAPMIFVALLAIPAQARVLIIPKKGASVWAKSTNKSGSRLLYVGDDGPSSMPLKDVDYTINSVERGKRYTPKEIDAAIASIAAARRRHPNLNKQLDPIRDEWSALKRGDADNIGTSIRQVDASFDPKTATLKDLKGAKSKLGMLKYRDLKKEHTGTIDKLSASLTEAYVKHAMERLKSRAAKSPKLHAHVRAVTKLADDVVAAAADDPRAKEALKLKESELAAAEKAIVTDAARSFNRGKTIDGYLAARASLRAWQRLLPKEDPRIAVTEGHINNLVRALKTTQPNYDFSNRGFPFTRADYTVLKATINNATNFKPNDPTEDIVFLFPPKPLSPLRAAQNPQLQFRALFNETPPQKGEWAFRIQPMGGNAPTLAPIRMGRLTNGATTIAISADLSSQAGNLPPIDGNNPNALGQLVHRPTPESEWQPKSWYVGLQVR